MYFQRRRYREFIHAWHDAGMINALPPEVLVQVLDALPVRIFWKDRDSRFLGCNKLFAADAGIEDPREFIGKSDYYFYHPDQAKAFRNDDAEVMWGGVAKLGILEQITDEDGAVRWVETSKLPLLNAAGEVIGVVGMYQDVTCRMTAQDGRCAA